MGDLEREINQTRCALIGIQKKINSGTLNGKSAYQVAVDNGFEGTEEEWLLSLQGGSEAAPPTFSNVGFTI